MFELPNNKSFMTKSQGMYCYKEVKANTILYFLGKEYVHKDDPKFLGAMYYVVELSYGRI